MTQDDISRESKQMVATRERFVGLEVEVVEEVATMLGPVRHQLNEEKRIMLGVKENRSGLEAFRRQHR